MRYVYLLKTHMYYFFIVVGGIMAALVGHEVPGMPSSAQDMEGPILGHIPSPKSSMFIIKMTSDLKKYTFDLANSMNSL